jgi:hypothetical protein
MLTFFTVAPHYFQATDLEKLAGDRKMPISDKTPSVAIHTTK